MTHYSYQNSLLSKKQLRQLLAWTFTQYNSIEASNLADKLKHLGFHYATQAGISISIEDLKVPATKYSMLQRANQEILDVEKLYLQGKMTEVERFQKTIDTWNLTSDSLKQQVVYFFKTYDPLNSVYIMAFSGARGNLSQVRQLVGMRGLMANTNGEIMNLAIQKNFREGLSITDYLMSGYGARKGIVDTALKTANSGYLTRRLIDVSQDILIREKNCFTYRSFLISIVPSKPKSNLYIYKKILGHVLNRPLKHPETRELVADRNTIITRDLIEKFQEMKIEKFYIRSPLTCKLYRAICQTCYGWDLANENLVDMGEAIGILAGQSIGEPGTQLTMRTFHTGGVFTSQTRQQITSPCSGIIKFYKFLKTRVIRNNQGNDVFITKNSGSLIVVPQTTTQDFVKIDVSKNTIIFPSHNQYVLKDTVIAEIINQNKQIRTEIKPILSSSSGEIVMPQLKKKLNALALNQLLWILSGKFYSSPTHSFLNFYSDYQINRFSFIFRTKVITPSDGWVESIYPKQNLYQGFLKLNYTPYSFINSKLKKFDQPLKSNHYLLELENFPYIVKATSKDSKLYLEISRNHQIAIYLTHLFTTLTGGTLYYEFYHWWKRNDRHRPISYFPQSRPELTYRKLPNSQFFSLQELIEKRETEQLIEKFGISVPSPIPAGPKVSYRTMIWVGEEVHPVNCESNRLLVENGDFISKKFELIPGLFSKTSGIVSLQQKNNWIENISIHSGLVYQSQELTTSSQTLYYPGEKILSNLTVSHLSVCENGLGKRMDQWLVRPIELFEVSYRTKNRIISQNKGNPNSNFVLKSISSYNYPSTQLLRGSQNVNLVSNLLVLKSSNILPSTTKMELCPISHLSEIQLRLSEKLNFNQYLQPSLRYKKIQSSVLVQAHQFIDQYTILAYLETLTKDDLQIVKLKVKQKNSSEKQILLISNEDCVTVPKQQFPKKDLNDFILENDNLHHIGKIILENTKVFTIQKGKLYFFPNCPSQDLKTNYPLEYKLSPISNVKKKMEWKKEYPITRYDFMKVKPKLEQTRKELANKPNELKEKIKELKEKIKKSSKSRDENYAVNKSYLNEIKYFSKNLKITKLKKGKFDQVVWKKNGNLYTSLLPGLYKAFSIQDSKSDSAWCSGIPFSENLLYPYFKTYNAFFNRNEDLSFKRQTLFVPPSTRRNPKLKHNLKNQFSFGFVYFIEHPFFYDNRAFGLSCITENYSEQEVNRLFCQNGEFIEKGETLGLLNLEKEITGDIVQGLPKVENILEARKNPIQRKRIPMSQKKGLLVQQTSLDQNFDFRKLGTSIQENDKINVHKLLTVYFNYYHKQLKFKQRSFYSFTYEDTRTELYYENSYRSFKKVQSFILNSVQAIYDQQGVFIHDKHLEVIIQQMTAKVIIQDEGTTRLVKNEVVDLYHIQRINEVVTENIRRINEQLRNMIIKEWGDRSLEDVWIWNDEQEEEETIYTAYWDNDMYIPFCKKEEKKEAPRPAFYIPFLIGISQSALNNPSFISAASFQETTRVLTKATMEGRMDWLRGLKENIVIGHFIPAGTTSTNYQNSFSDFSDSLDYFKKNLYYYRTYGF